MTKKILITFLLVNSIVQLFAQPWSDLLNPIAIESTNIPEYRLMMEDVNASWYDVEEAYYKYWADQNQAPDEEQGGSEFERYLDFMKSNSDENGFYQAVERDGKFWEKIRESRIPDPQRSVLTANWTPIGPDVMDPVGDANNSRMHSVYQDPTNFDILYVGAGKAGVWKSIDGGSTWTCISNSMEEATNIQTVLPDRTNSDHIIIASRDHGLFRTTDGGTTWTKNPNLDDANRLLQHPTIATTWFAAIEDGFYISTDNGVTWVQKLAGAKFWDIELHPTNPDIIYTLEELNDGNGGNQRIYKSIDGGENFTLLTVGLPADTDGDFSRAEIAVTPAAPDNLYAVYAEGTTHDGLYGVYISTDKGETFTFQCCNGSPGGPYSSTNPNILGYGSGTGAGGQLNYEQSLYVSPTDANIIFSGGVFLWYSTDMGLTWTKSDNSYHADNHGLLINTDGDIYTASDGGVHVSTDGGITFESLTNGIYGTEFIGDFGFSRKNAEVMIGGTIHNGAVGLYENNYSNWKFFAGGDLREGYVDAAQSIFRVSPNSSNNQIRRSKDGGASFSLLSTASRFITTHPNTPSILYSPDAGLYNLWKSEDDGGTWSKITNFSTTTTVNIEDIEICESAPDNIALNLNNAREIATSSDGGQTWTNHAIPIHGSRKVEDLIIDHTDPLTMWIVYDKEYVYKTTDGGNNWTLYNSGIDTSLDLRCITNHVGSNGAVYLGGENIVYYRDNSMSSWTSYSTGLPTYISIKDIEVIYDNNKIRLSSDRSVWESDLNSTASPKAAISASVLDVSDCDNLAVQFYDASFVPTTGTTWNWTFENGTPATSTLQNPTVAYNTVGSHDVTLQVTNGTSDTKTITDLITVNTIPTTALPVLEDIEDATVNVTTSCGLDVTLLGSLTNIEDGGFPGDNADWRVRSGTGHGNSSGPLADYTKSIESGGTETDGKYLYVRGVAGCGSRTAAMFTDCFDFNGLTEPTLTFAYNAIKTSGVSDPELHIDVLSNGVWTTDVLEVLGEQGARTGVAEDDWVVFNVDLSAFVNTISKIRIWGVTHTNGSSCDLALDGIWVYDATTLPVEWLSFTARLNDKEEAVLDWATASEINTDKFVIQKSKDGHSFENVGDVKAAQESNLIQNYTFLDNSPFQGITYYRIQQLDLDGTIDYSVIQSLKLEDSQTIKIYPNLLNSETPIYIETNSELRFHFKLFSSSGQKIIDQEVTGNQYLTLPSLPRGIYVYKIENNQLGKIGQLFIY